MPNRKSKFCTPEVEAVRLRTDVMQSTWVSALQRVEAAEDDHALALIADFNLQTYLVCYDDLIIDQVEFDAAHSHKLRRALTGIWMFSGMCPDVISRIRAIQKSVPDPLPGMLSEEAFEQLVGKTTEGAV